MIALHVNDIECFCKKSPKYKETSRLKEEKIKTLILRMLKWL